MTLVEKAHEIAKNAHDGQVDSQKKPYITHPEFVASLCETDEEKIVAYLHDTVEDTDVTIDQIREEFDDMSTQRFLRDVDFIDLALVLRGVSGAARKQVLSNLSPRVAVMITEDMEFMGEVELCDVADACLKALHILLLLVKRAEIVCSDAEAMATFGKIFDIAADIKRDRKIENEELEIYKIMRDYKLASHRTIKPTWKIVE